MKNNTNYFFRGILKTPPLKCNPKASTSYISLVCHRDINIFLLAVKSFLRFYNNVRIIILDGGLINNDFVVIRKHIKGALIYKRRFLDKIVNKKIKSKILRDLRKKDRSQIKLIDVNLLIKGKKIIVDSDILFLKKPSEIINWIENEKKKAFHHYRRPSEIVDTPDDWLQLSGGDFNKVFIKYYFLKNLKEINKKMNNPIKRFDFCSGLMGYNNNFSMKKIEKVEKALLSVVPKGYKQLWGIEQETYEFLLNESSRKLNYKKYFAVCDYGPTKDEIKNAKFIHFIGKLKHKEYLLLGKKIIKELKTLKN